MFDYHSAPQVKASLFAAGCFSEVSDDFGSVFLERLLILMTSPKTLPVLKVAGAQTLSKINYSVLLVIKSYKAGAELVRKFSEEDILAAMLISLTKLSSRTGILISEQIGLLSSFLAAEASLHMRATALRCMVCLVEKAAHFVPISAFAFHTLFKMLDGPKMPLPMRCDVLRIFLEILVYWLPDMQLTDMREFVNLLRYAQGTTQSSFLSERLLAFEILVCMSNKLKGRPEIEFEGNSETFPSGVALAVCDQITRLIGPVSDGTESSAIEQELGSMLRFLLVLVGNQSELGYSILDKLFSITENAVSHTMSLQDSAVHNVVNTTTEDSNFSMRMFMFQIHRFLVAFLEILDDHGAVTYQVVCKLKELVAFVCSSCLVDCSVHTFYALLHSHVSCSSLCAEGKSGFVLGISEMQIHECAANMLAGGDNWYAYRAGKYAACKGVWYVAHMIFQHLETRVQSQFCCQWLKFLVHITYLEKNAQMLVQQAFHSWSRDNDRMDAQLGGYIEKLSQVCDSLSSFDKVFEAMSIQAQTLYFQRWFLALRVKVLLVLVDILKLLDGIRQSGVNDANVGNPLVQKIKYMNEISSKLTRLAEECDLITSSFIEMDSKSVKVMSSFTVSCAMLGFCIRFTNLMVDSLVSKNPTENFGDSWYILVHDLAKRLCYTDSETSKYLMSILKDYGVYGSSLHLLPRFQFSKVGCISGDMLAVCHYIVEEMIQLKNKSQGVHNKDTTPQVSEDCMEFLRNIVAALTRINFRIPKYFFRVRPCIGSVLISSGAGSRKQSALLVSPGSELALNLCIQLKNIPSDTCSFSKIYCILYCKTSFLANRSLASCGEMQAGYQSSKVDMMIDLSKKLQYYVMKQTGEFSNCGNLQSDDEVEAYVCFETKGRPQGFSTCLLDVSAFPVGSYRIHWHSGFVDSDGAFWSLLPLSPGPVFRVGESISLVAK
ncbi:hypothetical protein Cgig2_023025 [Carnegiea gigantea]|uniref:Integrator complex subunit 7 n=1 Tax=Carnegiea gigantea TaxID=171969 RepID=A0A9Q1K8P3_9CARY|nr:hypothetical protein Cgig2_023025 [Carnegiea gigantea]